MSIYFRTLLNVTVNHSYYAATCSDFDFLTPVTTQARLAAGRILARVRDGALILLCETDKDGKPIADLAGTTLLFGLTLNNPYFSNFTEAVVDAGFLPVYANQATPAAFDPPLAARLASRFQEVVPSAATRPLTVSLRAGATVVASETLESGDDRAVFDTQALRAGVYTLREDAGGAPVDSTLVVEPGLSGAWGVLAITLDASFYTAEQDFSLDFTARTETLKYYVVARNYPSSEFALLSVADVGYSADGRPNPIEFDAVARDDFPADDNTDELLCQGTDQIVLFQSRDPVARRDKGYPKIQLSNNGEILVTHLPQPGADRPQAHLVVHLSKP